MPSSYSPLCSRPDLVRESITQFIQSRVTTWSHGNISPWRSFINGSKAHRCKWNFLDQEMHFSIRTVGVNCNIFSIVFHIFVRHGQTSSGNLNKHSLKKWGRAGRNIEKYITVHPSCTVSLSEFSFFKPLHLLIRTHQVPVLLICPLALSRVKSFFVLVSQQIYFIYHDHGKLALKQMDLTRCMAAISTAVITIFWQVHDLSGFNITGTPFSSN